MQLYPAIDIRDGKCVRLTQGLFDNVKIYSDTPADMARLWESRGASFLHLVDLDGALAGRSVNEEAIRAVIAAAGIPAELGGGIRSAEDVRRMLKLGVSRCIIGTKAAERPELMHELVEEFGPDRIVAGVDAKNGMAAVDGWEKVSGLSALELCRKMKTFGVRHIIYTDISRDGMLTGPNVKETRRLTEETGLDIIASGGVSSMEDLEQLAQNGIRGAVIGKALYEGRVDLAEAVKRFEKEEKPVIRPAEITDLESILRVYEQARAFMAGHGNPTQWGTSYPSEDLLRQDIAKRQLFVVTEKEEIHGVFFFAVEEDPTYRVIRDGAWLSDSEYGVIHRIAGDGTVHGLLRLAVSYCGKKNRHLRIDTHADNTVMQHVIRKNGFVRCGIVHMEDGSPRIAYERLG